MALLPADLGDEGADRGIVLDDQHALLPPIDHLGQIPPIRSSLFENFHQAGAVDHLGQSQDVGRVLPFTVGHADGWNIRPRCRGAIARRGLVRLVWLVRVLFELERHFRTILVWYPRRGSNPRWTGFKPAASAIGLRGH